MVHKDNLNNYIRGWLVGKFSPSILDRDNIEVGVKKYKAGDFEKSHYHKLSTEITIIVLGEVEMNNIKYIENDIIFIEPGESTDFKCITDVITLVLRDKSVINDKY